jgi:hypothetical protein
MQTLQEIFNEIGNLTDKDFGGNDKGGKIHTYLETYDRLFASFRTGCTMLEIGLAMGDSIKLWDRYFENSKILELDATTPKILDYIDDNSLQIVVEDASHMEADSIKIFKLLKPKMAKGSIYFIEDILNLELSRKKFEALHDNCEIIDMRKVNGRFDNCLIAYRF